MSINKRERPEMSEEDIKRVNEMISKNNNKRRDYASREVEKYNKMFVGVDLSKNEDTAHVEYYLNVPSLSKLTRNED